MSSDISPYNWSGVLQFLYTEYQKVSMKENIWFLQKKQLLDQIKQLEGKLMAAQAINIDLRNKNNMLEYCIRDIKFKNNQQKQKDNKQQLKQNQNQKQKEIPIPQRRAKSNKNQINKILTSLGLSNLLDNVIKDNKQKNVNNGMKIQIPSTNNDKKIENNQKIGKYKLVSHLQQHSDGVRDICFLNDKQYLISVSQDSTMKVWNTQRYRQKIDCLTTIKEHSGPIFTAIEGDGLLFTGGMQGIVRCWNFPRKNVNSKKCLVSQWTNSDDQKLQPIWQLLYYPQKKMLFSTSSQPAIRSFQLQIQQNTVSSKYKHAYIYQSKHNQQQDIPTAICIHNNSLYAGYVNNNILIQFNLQNQKPINTLQFNADGQISTNKIISNGNIIAGAFQDGIIRIFDQSKLTHSFKGHQQSVMSVTFTNNPYQLFSCGQEGFIKLWDIRQYKQVISFQGHKKKYDESCHCISFGGDNLIASGGVDGIINIYAIQH